MFFNILGCMVRLTAGFLIFMCELQEFIHRHDDIRQPIQDLGEIEQSFVDSYNAMNTGVPDTRNSSEFKRQVGSACTFNFMVYLDPSEHCASGSCESGVGISSPEQQQNYVLLFNEELRDYNGTSVNLIFCACSATPDGVTWSSKEFIIAKKANIHHYYHFEPVYQLNGTEYFFKITGYYQFSHHYTKSHESRTRYSE